MIRREVQIGEARLILGDARAIVPSLVGIGAVVSDPPFGMAFRSNHRAVQHEAIENDGDTELLKWACGLPAEHSKYIFCRWDNLAELPKPKSMVTWVKNNWSMGDLQHEHARQTEVALFYPGVRHDFPNGRPTDVIEAPRTGNTFHPTEKPVQLMMAILRWTRGTVLDPFMGSGSTGVACARAGRAFIGIEIDEGYFETACRRVSEAHSAPDFFVQPRDPEPKQGSIAMSKTLVETQAELNAAGFWCVFKKRRTVLHVTYTPQVDGGTSEHVATFNRAVDQCDIDRLIVWKNRQTALELYA